MNELLPDAEALGLNKTPMTDAHDRAILAASEEARAVKYGCLELARQLERECKSLRETLAKSCYDGRDEAA